MSEYWTSDSQAWIMPVLVELCGEGMTSRASDWAALRSEAATRLANRGAGAMADNLLQPLDDAASSGTDTAALISGLVTEYQMSVSGAAVVGGAAATPVPRFASVEPVEGRPGWWQGYDNQDQTWKYVAATDTPGDHTTGWTPAAQMDWSATAGQASPAAATPTTVPRFASVEPVDGRPGWWQGYDNQDQTWKYVAATDTPGDHTTGWTPAAQMDWTATAKHGPHEPGNDPAPATRGESAREQARANIEAILKSAPSLGEGVDIEAIVNSVTTQE